MTVRTMVTTETAFQLGSHFHFLVEEGDPLCVIRAAAIVAKAEITEANIVPANAIIVVVSIAVY